MNVSWAQIISLVIGTVLPLLAGLTVRIDAHPRVRSVVLLALAAATSFLTELGGSLNAHQPFNIGSALLSVLVTFVAGVATNYGLWEPIGAASAAKAVGGFIGGSRPTPTPTTATYSAVTTVPVSPTGPAIPPGGPAGTSPPAPPA